MVKHSETEDRKGSGQRKAERIEVNEMVELEIGEEKITMLVMGQRVMKYQQTDEQANRYAAIQLLEGGLATTKEVVTGFGIARSTLQDNRKKYQEEGLAGLQPAKSGPKEAWKMVKRVKRIILDSYYQEPERTMRELTSKVNEQLEKMECGRLSQGHIRRFLTDVGLLPRQGEGRVEEVEAEEGERLKQEEGQAGEKRSQPEETKEREKIGQSRCYGPEYMAIKWRTGWKQKKDKKRPVRVSFSFRANNCQRFGRHLRQQ